jgi:hypothetical protein
MPYKVEPPLYRVWASMLQRCRNPRARQYQDYGGRGIRVCDKWLTYKNFEDDMPPRPSLSHSIDRIDNDGHYEPGNVRWATKREQMMNQRRAVFVTIEGSRYRAIELAEKAGVKADTIIARANRGLPLSEVLRPDKLLNRRVPVEAVAKRLANKAAETHCKNGHPWTPENTRITPQGWRNCRACHREKMRLRQGYYSD